MSARGIRGFPYCFERKQDHQNPKKIRSNRLQTRGLKRFLWCSGGAGAGAAVPFRDVSSQHHVDDLNVDSKSCWSRTISQGHRTREYFFY